MPPPTRTGLLEIPRSIWVLGFVSLFMDISSEMVHSLLPVFMVSTLGASALAVGIIEGVAEATALITKVFSGTISDYLGRRKALAVFGYGLGALSKPLFAIARSVDGVFLARFIDRIGKGTRGAPRDALIADLTPEPIRGAAYGLRQSLDTVGAFLGPLLAILLMNVWAGNYRAVFWTAVIPGFISVALLVAGIREPEGTKSFSATQKSMVWGALKRMGAGYWWVVTVGAIFTLARFSEAFLLLQAHRCGLPGPWVPGVLILMNVVYAASAYPFGRLADRFDRRVLLAGGLLVLVASDLALAFAGSLPLVVVGVILWGLHMGMTQGLLATLVAGSAPSESRGTAFGFFNLASGGAVLLASAVAGLLWTKQGPATTFFTGAIFAMVALLVLLVAPGGSLRGPTKKPVAKIV